MDTRQDDKKSWFGSTAWAVKELLIPAAVTTVAVLSREGIEIARNIQDQKLDELIKNQFSLVSSVSNVFAIAH